MIAAAYNDDDEDDWEDEEVIEDDESATIECPQCGADIYQDAPQCPVCGTYVVFQHRSHLHGKPLWYVLLALLGIGAVIFACLRF